MTIKKMMLAAAVLAMGASAALAQNGAPPRAAAARMSACRDDAQKLCPDKTGPDRRACMEANKDKLSDACKAARAARASGGGQ